VAARKQAKATKGRRSPSKSQGRSKRPRRNGADGPVIGYLGRSLRTLAHWAVVAVIIGIGLIGSVIAFYASKLPPMADWTVPPRAVNVRILASNGALISNAGDSTGEALKLDQMPPFLPEAVIAIEDRRFYWNFGIDPIGLVRAAIVNLRAGHVVEGGSTLTQQLAKNLFLKPERTFERKVQEMIMAVWLQMRLSKSQILALYLNRVYLGAGAYGVDAAAHRYFGKSARDITLAEAATLAGMLKAPANYSPATHPAASEARMQTVLAAMQSAGYITPRQASLAMSMPVNAVHDVAGGSGRYVADWLMDKVPQYVGGSIDQDIIVDTTIDLSMQAAAAEALSQTLDEGGVKYKVGQAALVAIDPSGAVKALVGGRDYKTSPFNRAVDAHRQPGSAFKPFVYLTALEDGMIPESVIVDQPVSIAGWKPENYTRNYKGPVTLRTALADSLNSVSAQLTQIVTPQAVAATARRLGILSPLMATPSIALGTSEVTPLELTAAYVPFSNGGRGVIPYAIKRITTAKGQVLYERSGTGPGQVVDPTYIGMMNSMLSETVIDGTGTNARLQGWPVAGKTGTSQDFRDAWFIGYTGALTAGVWFGNDDNMPTKHATGGSLPAIAWQRFMSAALAGQAVAGLPGNYHFGDPTNVRYAGRPIYPSDMTSAQAQGAPMALTPGAVAAGPDMPQGGWIDQGQGRPMPPAAIGQQRRREGPIASFLQQLFGG
jgi:penicillin-binding protein 1A